MILIFPCGHGRLFTLAELDAHLSLLPGGALVVGGAVFYCAQCWRDEGKAVWREPGDLFTYAPNNGARAPRSYPNADLRTT